MEIWRALCGTAANIYDGVQYSNIFDIKGLKYFEPFLHLFSECFKRLTSGDFSLVLDDLILAVFFGGFCMVLW